MKLCSWNVNGLRACLQKGFEEFLRREEPEILCLQEIKMNYDQLDREFEGYETVFNSAETRGYSGTAILSKRKPLAVSFDIGDPKHTGEGRSITFEFERFYLVAVYTPNAQHELTRLSYRMQWDDAFRDYVCALDRKKPVVICGDFNVAYRPIDLKNPAANRQNAGFSDEERGKFAELLAAGFTDTYRYFYPEKKDAYSWWSYRFASRERDVGWRIDYFLVSNRLQSVLQDAFILKEQQGSDHCPVGILLREDAIGA